MMLSSDELRELIDGLARLPYGGEAVDQRRHALQCAGQAVAAGADGELVLAAALHDIGYRWDEGAKDPAQAGLPLADLLGIFDRYRMAQAR
jgi:gamma-butyrobetaine dioxygenase